MNIGSGVKMVVAGLDSNQESGGGDEVSGGSKNHHPARLDIEVHDLQYSSLD